MSRDELNANDALLDEISHEIETNSDVFGLGSGHAIDCVDERLVVDEDSGRIDRELAVSEEVDEASERRRV